MDTTKPRGQPWGRTTLVALALWIPVTAESVAERTEDSATLGIASVADCTRPDGTEFSAEVVSLPDGTTRFVQRDASGDRLLLVVPARAGAPADGNREQAYRRSDTGTWEAVGPEFASFVHGHDVHRLYLEAREADGREPTELTRMNPDAFGGGKVTISFSDPMPLIGDPLPRTVSFVHGGERFEYRFRSLLVFRLGPGTPMPTEPAALDGRLADLHRLTTLHERVMQAHRDGDVEALLADQADVGLLAGRGELGENTHDVTRQRLGAYLANSTFEYYVDRVAPVVSVARDGSLGWVACEMEAKGEELMESGEIETFEFGYTWLELYAKPDNRWWRTGNISSARP